MKSNRIFGAAVGRRRVLNAIGGAGVAAAMGPASAFGQGAVPSAVIDVRDFGAKGDGRTDDADAIAKAIQTGIAKGQGATVFFPAGRYKLGGTQRAQINTPYAVTGGLGVVYARPAAHMLVQGARGLTLAGEPGTLLIMTSMAAAGVLLERCADVTLRQLAIDYDPLPFTQGTIVALDPAAGKFDLRVDAGFPPATEERFRTAEQADGSVRDARTPEIVKVTAGRDGVLYDVNAGGIVGLGPDLFRLAVAAPERRGIAVGDRFVFPARTNGNGQAVAQYFTERCMLDRITVHSAPVVAFILFGCESPIFRECVIEPLPGSGRLLSANADGIHCKWARGTPLVERCRFIGIHDDAFTFHSMGQRVLRREGDNTLIVERNEFFRAGDEIAVIEQTEGRTRGTATIREAALVRWRDGVAVRLLLDRMPPDVVAFESLGQDTLPPRNLDAVTPLNRRADLVADLATLGTGFIVRDCVFARFRGGSRAYAGGTIEGNRFEHIAGYPIRVGMDLQWPEVYHATGLTIRKNIFVGNTALPNVRIQDVLGNGRTGRTFGNRDITIADNRFEGYGPAGAILVNNAASVRIEGNIFDGPADVPAVTLDLARDVTVDAPGPARTIIEMRAETGRGSVRLAGQIAIADRASAGFSGNQGVAQWRYRSWDGTRYQDLSYDAAAAAWRGAGTLQIWRDRQHPGAADAVRSWKADRDGDVRITGRVGKAVAGGDGVLAEIVHGGERIWSADIAGDNLVGVAHDVARRVRRGEEVHFRVGRRANVAFDSTSWDPVILLTS